MSTNRFGGGYFRDASTEKSDERVGASEGSRSSDSRLLIGRSSNSRFSAGRSAGSLPETGRDENKRPPVNRGFRNNPVSQRSADTNPRKEPDAGKANGDSPEQLEDKPVVVGAESLQHLEETTNYGNIKDETFKLLREISQEKAMPQEALRSISDEISSRFEQISASTILSLINALAPVDEYLQRHCVNVSLLNGLIGTWLGLSKMEVDNLVLIGLLHDCGKALIPHSVLMAPRKLTIVEFEVMKMHASNSFDLLVEFPDPVRHAARSHHERLGGFGYPDRLADDDIPFQSRVTAISDIYDAMVSQRAYKRPMSPFTIMATLDGMKSSELDSELVDTFIAYIPLELIGKHALMSDGSVGVVRSFDRADPEYPMIEINGQIIKTSKELYCTSMYLDD